MATRRDPRLLPSWTAPTVKRPVVVQDPLAATPVTNAIPGQPQTNTVAPQPGAVRTITDPMAGTVAPVVMPQTVNNNVQPQQVQNSVQPTVTDPMAVAPVTASQGFGTTVSNQVQAPPVGNTGGTQPRPSLFGNTATGIGDAYTGTLRDALTGKIYDPMAAGTKEAMARAEANRRASTANQIAGAGFSGTGIGQQIAGGLEGDISKQRYDTMIGIEQARNQGRVSALGEARAYGTAEEGIRQYEKDFGESARRFDVGQANWEKTFAEDQSRYKDTQNWKAYEEALVNGSDADVVAAYKAATGKDLDPAAVTQYRDYYRKSKELGLEGQRISNDAAQQAVNEMKRTQAGTTLSNYLATHLDSDMTDPALSPMMQKYWESLGNTGPVPPDWAAQQVKAARDVRVNTEIGAMNYQIDELVASGQMKPEDAALLKDFNSGGMTQFLVRDPATGKVKFDVNAYLASVNGETSNPSDVDSSGNKISEKKEGEYYQGKDGNTYQISGGSSSLVSPEDFPMATVDYDPKSGIWKSKPAIGDTVKMPVIEDGKQRPEILTLKSSNGKDEYYFESPDGTKWKAYLSTFNGQQKISWYKEVDYKEASGNTVKKYIPQGNVRP